jgi:hypothetical protein
MNEAMTARRRPAPGVHAERTPDDGCERKSERIAGIDDLARSDVRTSLPNPVHAQHRENADRDLALLATKVVLDLYARFGFVKARPDELILKPID